jgi:hypothetical protein
MMCAVRRLTHDGAREKANTRFANVPGSKVERLASPKQAEVSFEEAKKLGQQK